MEYITDGKSNICFLQETWLKCDQCKALSDIKDYGYKLIHSPRDGSEKSRGGGVGFVVKIDLSPRKMPSGDYSSFEHIIIRLPLNHNQKGGGHLFLVSLYRLQDVAINVFFDEFSEFLSTNLRLSKNFIIAGDFNIHIDMNDASTRQFNQILEIYSLIQHVNDPTHIAGHTLDLVITSGDVNKIIGFEIRKIDISDHFLINFESPFSPPRTYEKEITFRSLHKINNDAFSMDVTSNINPLLLQQYTDITSATKYYHNALTSLMEKHAPIKSKIIKIKENAPWFNSEYTVLRRKRRAAEKRYRRTGLDVHKQEFIR